MTHLSLADIQPCEKVSTESLQTDLTDLNFRIGEHSERVAQVFRELDHLAESVAAQQITKEQINNENESGDTRR